MFIFLSKLLAPLVYPLGWATALWLAGLVLHRIGRPIAGTRCIAAGLGVILIFSNPLVGDAFLGSLENDYQAAPVVSYAPADVIIVLGGVTASPMGPRLEVEVGEGFDRLLHGVRLLRAERAPRLLLSGGSIGYLSGSDIPEAHSMAALAQQVGVSSDQLVLETQSRNTHENGANSARILRERGWQRAILVTSAAHMTRAMGVFQRQGIEVVAAPADFLVGGRPLSPMRLMPDVNALYMSTKAAKEYVGRFIYWLRGYV